MVGRCIEYMYTNHLTKNLIYIICCTLVFWGMTGCAADDGIPNRQLSLSLEEVGISFENSYGEHCLELFPIPKYIGIKQINGDDYPEGNHGIPNAPGNYTYIISKVENVARLDSGYLSPILFALYAYPKSKMEDAIVSINTSETIDYKEYTFEQLKPYIFFETEEYIIYDLLLFGSDETFEEFIERRYGSAFKNENSLKYNPEYAEYDYVKLQVDVRNWLIEQIKQDYPLP